MHTEGKMEMEMKQKTGRRPGRPTGQSDVLTADEINRLLQVVKDRRTTEGARDYAVLLILANTPARKGELVTLNLENVKAQGGVYSISRKALKKKKPTWITTPIDAEAYAGIMAYVRKWNLDPVNDAQGPLFFTLGGRGGYKRGRLTSKSVDCLVKKYARLAGITKRITPHSFRASYLTLRSQGHKPETLATLSGHASLASILPYLRSTAQEREEAALSVSFA
jgi:integrase/recombinase XerD